MDPLITSPAPSSLALTPSTLSAGLQQVYSKYRDYGLEILAFPCNQCEYMGSPGEACKGWGGLASGTVGLKMVRNPLLPKSECTTPLTSCCSW